MSAYDAQKIRDGLMQELAALEQEYRRAAAPILRELAEIEARKTARSHVIVLDGISDEARAQIAKRVLDTFGDTLPIERTCDLCGGRGCDVCSGTGGIKP